VLWCKIMMQEVSTRARASSRSGTTTGSTSTVQLSVHTAMLVEDPFANIAGGGGIGKTSLTASSIIPVSSSGSSNENITEKYHPPPLYPEVAIDKRSVKPLVDEDYYLLNKHRLLRSRNRQSPYYLKKLQLYNLEQQQQQQLEKAKLSISNGYQEANNFGIGKVRLTPVYFPCELMNDSLRKVSLIRKERIEKRKKKKKKKADLVDKSKDLLKEFGLTESGIEGKEPAKEEEKEEEEKEQQEQEEEEEEQDVDIAVEEDIADYDFTDDYQYMHVDDDEDMGDEDTLNAMGAGDEGPLL